jgi:hypothetical protein
LPVCDTVNRDEYCQILHISICIGGEEFGEIEPILVLTGIKGIFDLSKLSLLWRELAKSI